MSTPKHKIVQRVGLGGQLEKRIIVRHPLPLARRFVFGSDWTHVRIGVRAQTLATHTGYPVTLEVSLPPWYLGVASSAGVLPGGKAPKHFVGMMSNNTGATQVQSDLTSFSISASSIVNGTITAYPVGIQGGMAAYWDAMRVANVSWHPFWFGIDIIKGSPYTVIPSWTRAQYSGTVDGITYANHAPVTSRIFGDHMRTPVLPSDRILQYTNTSFTINETTNGQLDTLCFAWLHGGHDMAFEVLDIAFTRFS